MKFFRGESQMKKNGEIKVCLVGSSGGHLTHLYMLKPFWKDKNRFWVTFDKEDILFAVNFQGEYLQYYIVLTLMYLGGTLNINRFFFGIEEYKGVAIRDMVIKIATFVLIVLCVNNEHDL